MTKKSILFNNKRLEITINRLCQQLIENHKTFKNTVLIGLQPRGIYFLNRIKKNLEKNLKKEIRTGYLDTTFYRDDFRSGDIPTAKETSIPFIVDDKDVIIIDDVLFTGRSIRSAIDALMAFGRPRSVELLTLIDRRFSRDLPIQPNYVGKTIDAVQSEKIVVQWEEIHGIDRVLIRKSDNE